MKDKDAPWRESKSNSRLFQLMVIYKASKQTNQQNQQTLEFLFLNGK